MEPLSYYETDGYHQCGTQSFEDNNLRQFRAYWLYTFAPDLTLIVPPCP